MRQDQDIVRKIRTFSLVILGSGVGAMTGVWIGITTSIITENTVKSAFPGTGALVGFAIGAVVGAGLAVKEVGLPMRIVEIGTGLYSFFVVASLSLLVADSLIWTVSVFGVAVSLLLFLAGFLRPARRNGRFVTPRVVQRLRRVAWIIASLLVLGSASLLWAVVGVVVARGLGLPSWQLFFPIHIVGGLAFLYLLRITPADEKILPLAGKESLGTFRAWRRQLRQSWASNHYTPILEILLDNDPQTVAAFLFWLEANDVKTARQTMQFIENTPFVRKLVGPVRASRVETKDPIKWVREHSYYWTNSSKRLSTTSKRLVDFFLAMIAFFGPLLPIAWLLTALLAIRYRSVRQVLFISLRVGGSGSIFRHYQFRTLWDIESGLSVDNRLGRLIIWAKFDQIPALWNVITGKMSLIGPYPMYPSYLQWRASQEELIEKIKVRLSVRPGILDPASVDALSRPALYQCEGGCLEIHYDYITNWSLPNEVGIFIRAILLYLGFRLPNGLYSFIYQSPLPPLGPTVATIPLENAFLPVPPVRDAFWVVPRRLRREKAARLWTHP